MHPQLPIAQQERRAPSTCSTLFGEDVGATKLLQHAWLGAVYNGDSERRAAGSKATNNVEGV